MTSALAQLRLLATASLPNDIFVHETTGSVSAAEPFRTVSVSGAGQQASASGQAAANISAVVSQAGVVTISGSSSGSANAQYQGCCEGTAVAQARAAATLP